MENSIFCSSVPIKTVSHVTAATHLHLEWPILLLPFPLTTIRYFMRNLGRVVFKDDITHAAIWRESTVCSMCLCTPPHRSPPPSIMPLSRRGWNQLIIRALLHVKIYLLNNKFLLLILLARFVCSSVGPANLISKSFHRRNGEFAVGMHAISS